MYQQFFGLNEQPFSIAVNPRYLFMSARHRDALAHLLYGVGSGGGFILLTGGGHGQDNPEPVLAGANARAHRHCDCVEPSAERGRAVGNCLR